MVVCTYVFMYIPKLPTLIHLDSHIEEEQGVEEAMQVFPAFRSFIVPEKAQ